MKEPERPSIPTNTHKCVKCGYEGPGTETQIITTGQPTLHFNPVCPVCENNWRVRTFPRMVPIRKRD